MDPEAALLAGTAGATLVSLLTTEAWQRARDGISLLWRRAQPERAEAVAAELDATRSDLLAAEIAGDPDTRDELGAEWQGRIRRLLVTNPEATDALRRLIDELDPTVPVPSVVTQRATASGDARIYQAGRDQNVTQS
ncbi:hypothetical protein ACFTUC_38140 [Streptomyces sp. NPDC056944]|uniref:hypothetical protein n=1 Tax=unclassified Streptomyces TaxID=2593676 RepID=UPI00363994C2